MSKRMVESLLEFECNASILANALNLGTEKIIFLPHENHLMITNLGDVFSVFNLLTSECFSEYKLKTEIQDEWFENQETDKLPAIVVDRKDFSDLLDQIKGKVRITIEDPKPGELRYILVKDLVEGNEFFEGRFKIQEEIIDPIRHLAGFVEFYDSENLMLPKITITIGEECHILKIKENVKFDPMIMGKEYKHFIISSRALNPDEFEIQLFNQSSMSEYSNFYKYDFIQSTNEKRFQKYDNHSKTIYKFPANPATMDLVLKYQMADPKYLTVIEVDDDVAPFLIFFSSVKDMGDAGKVYTSALLFLEGDTDINDAKVATVE